MKGQVESSLKERSTSARVEEKTGCGVSADVTSKILFDLRIRRLRLGSLVRMAMAERVGDRGVQRVCCEARVEITRRAERRQRRE
jgi:hypothetical protein